MLPVAPDSLPSGVLQLDSADRIVGANNRVSEWAGVDPSLLLGRPFETVVRRPDSLRSPAVEFLPAVAEITHADGSVRPVLVAEAPPTPDGLRFVVLFEATAQRSFREAVQGRLARTQRNQTRLELVIAASIAFSEAMTETQLAEVLAETTARAYSAEKSVVFFFDPDMVLLTVAGSNPFAGLGDAVALSHRAAHLRSVITISGIDAARATNAAIADAFESTGVQSMIVAPIHQGDQPLGVVAAFFYHPRSFDEQASPLADALAGQAARAISGMRLQQKLEHSATHDETTGLPNRRRLDERMEKTPRAADAFIGVIFVDLDGFKAVNDTLGHLIGDDILREVAKRLDSTVREEDIVARYGGDEFVIVCEVGSSGAVLEMAERVRVSIRAPYDLLPEGLTLGASIGISVTSTKSPFTGIDRLVRAADEAMYRAKHAGGDQIVSAGNFSAPIGTGTGGPR
jgi:diguanylate cyclase (GGDEF)-like protein